MNAEDLAKKQAQMRARWARSVKRAYRTLGPVTPSVGKRERFSLHSLAHACRIAASIGDNPAFKEAHLFAAEIFDLADKEEESDGSKHRNDA